MIAAVAAVLIVRLSDNLAPESSTSRMQCHLRQETIFAQDRLAATHDANLQPSSHAPLAPTVEPQVRGLRSQQPVTNRERAFRGGRVPEPEKPALRQKPRWHKILDSRAKTRLQK
jgi:hypothetical protein